MSETMPAEVASHPFARFFGVLWSGPTYVRFAYLIVEFALATFSFTLMISILAVGLSLVWTFIGVPILFFALVLARALTGVECQMAERVSGLDMPQLSPVPETGGGVWSRIFALLKDGDSWLSALHLIVRFPVATAAFSIAVGLIGAGVWGVFLPVAVALGYVDMTWGIWHVDTVPKALIFVVPGAALVLLGLHAVNGLTRLMAEFTRLLTGRLSHARVRDRVLRMLVHGRVLDGPAVLRELQLYHGYSLDLTPASVYATLIELRSAGQVESMVADGIEWFRLTPEGERTARAA